MMNTNNTFEHVQDTAANKAATPSTFKEWWAQTCSEATAYFEEWKTLRNEFITQARANIAARRKYVHEERVARVKSFFNHPIRHIARFCNSCLQLAVSLSIIAIACIMIQDWVKANPDLAMHFQEVALHIANVVEESVMDVYTDMVDMFQAPFRMFGLIK